MRLAVVEVGDVGVRRCVDPFRVGLAEERRREHRRLVRDEPRGGDGHADEEQRERDRDRDEQAPRQQCEREDGHSGEGPDDDVVASQLPDRDQGERVGERRLVDEPAERERQHERGCRERNDVRGGAPSRCAAVDPEAQADEEQRRQPEQVALGKPTDVARGEQPDLGDETRRERKRHRQVGANLRRGRTRERQRRDRAGRDDADEQEEVGGVVEAETKSAPDRVLGTTGGRVRAEPARADAGSDHHERDERRPEADERRPRPSGGGIDHDREHEGGHKDDALEPRQDREHDDTDEQRLRPQGRRR